jgi:hypothetical protein
MKSRPDELLIGASPDAVDTVLGGMSRARIDQLLERGLEPASC